MLNSQHKLWHNKHYGSFVFQVDNDSFKLGCAHGRLDGRYSRNQIDPCQTKHLKEEEVPDEEMTLREAARAQSGGKGQGFLKCTCRKSCTKRCKCVKNGLKCSSKCHHSLTCNNKWCALSLSYLCNNCLNREFRYYFLPGHKWAMVRVPALLRACIRSDTTISLTFRKVSPDRCITTHLIWIQSAQPLWICVARNCMSRPLSWHAPRAVVITHMNRHWSWTRTVGW